jgi:hypothetical protein
MSEMTSPEELYKNLQGLPLEGRRTRDERDNALVMTDFDSVSPDAVFWAVMVPGEKKAYPVSLDIEDLQEIIEQARICIASIRINHSIGSIG